MDFGDGGGPYEKSSLFLYIPELTSTGVKYIPKWRNDYLNFIT